MWRRGEGVGTLLVMDGMHGGETRQIGDEEQIIEQVDDLASSLSQQAGVSAICSRNGTADSNFSIEEQRPEVCLRTPCVCFCPSRLSGLAASGMARCRSFAVASIIALGKRARAGAEVKLGFDR